MKHTETRKKVTDFFKANWPTSNICWDIAGPPDTDIVAIQCWLADGRFVVVELFSADNGFELFPMQQLGRLDESAYGIKMLDEFEQRVKDMTPKTSIDMPKQPRLSALDRFAQECGREPISFQDFLSTMGADDPLWLFDEEADEFNMECWREVTDYDIKTDGTSWWAFNKELPMCATVYVQTKDRQGS